MSDSNNVTPIESKLPAPAGAKFIITASIDGFPVSVEIEGKAGDLRTLVDRLKAIGTEPPQVQTSAQASTAVAEPTKKSAAIEKGAYAGAKAGAEERAKAAVKEAIKQMSPW